MRYLTLGTAAFVIALAGCDVNQTSQGEAPSLDVDVSADEGALPSFDVDWADVDVATRTKTVEVPKLVVVMEEEQVEVPAIDVSMPNENDADKTERTVAVEAEISGEMQKLRIKDVYAKDRKLVVVSTLTPTGESLQEQRVRVSDRLVLNAPENLEVKHIIIGEQPQGDWNSQYSFVANEAAAKQRVQGATQIFSR